ncbi:hypothetical protein QQS21_005585 [Conoideocrella luteorostrata]|uniref:UBC core domain-containing protein n=1 Tax=Conoideocrella luteorostrata TaxID=1105319 RepID=A0AAJ0CP85_9HYPO|nr:hypothetical protein QQS21_005585 [Conoideocrella luteorostrata]
MAAAANTTPQFSSKSPTIRRILREAAEISSSPSADYAAEPLDSDLFEWHFTLRGPPKSVYSDGLYHGRIILPPTYPLRPPSFRFTTPNGRFEANREICLSISGHHEETWQPAWGIRTAIVALRSFMETDARGQLGGLDTTDEVRRHLARESRSFRCPTCAQSNMDIISESGKKASESLVSSTSEIQIPPELSMGWRDEMTAKRQDPERDASTLNPLKVSSDEGCDPEIAEGFVQTGPVDRSIVEESQSSISAATNGSSSSSSAERLGESRAALMDGSTVRPASRLQIRQRQSSTTERPHDGVPLWIDRAIVALVIVLAALLLKVLFGI